MNPATDSIGFACRLGESERELLGAFRGRELISVATDGWAVELTSPHGTLRLEPESMRTADREHPIAGVSRPKVCPTRAPSDDVRMREVARNLGPIEKIEVDSTVVTFSRPRKVGRAKLAGVAMPGGIEYRPLFRRPSALQTSQAEGAVVLLDVAVRCKVAGHEVVVYTNGTGPFLSVTLDGKPSPGWEKRDRPIRETEPREIER